MITWVNSMWYQILGQISWTLKLIVVMGTHFDTLDVSIYSTPACYHQKWQQKCSTEKRKKMEKEKLKSLMTLWLVHPGEPLMQRVFLSWSVPSKVHLGSWEDFTI